MEVGSTRRALGRAFGQGGSGVRVIGVETFANDRHPMPSRVSEKASRRMKNHHVQYVRLQCLPPREQVQLFPSFGSNSWVLKAVGYCAQGTVLWALKHV